MFIFTLGAKPSSVPVRCRTLWVGPDVTETITILVAEDDHGLLGFLEEALEDGGFKARMHSSGEEAAASLAAGGGEFRALVTDVNMRGMSGWDLARKAREAEPSFPVIYMTGAAADEWAVHGVPGSILLQKPFAPAQLTTAISQLLNVAAPPPPSETS